MQIQVIVLQIKYIMKKIFILYLIIFSLTCTICIGSTENNLDTFYRKNNYLNKYQGIWVYQNDSIKLTLNLKLFTKKYIQEINTYIDQLYGNYKYEKNGEIREDSLKELKNHTLTNETLDSQSLLNSSLPLIYFDCNENGDISIQFKRLKNNTILNLLGQGSEKFNNPDEMNISISYHHNFDTDESMKLYWEQNLFPNTMIFRRIISDQFHNKY